MVYHVPLLSVKVRFVRGHILNRSHPYIPSRVITRKLWTLSNVSVKATRLVFRGITPVLLFCCFLFYFVSIELLDRRVLQSSYLQGACDTYVDGAYQYWSVYTDSPRIIVLIGHVYTDSPHTDQSYLRSYLGRFYMRQHHLASGSSRPLYLSQNRT